jgi:hypothetical protein
VAEGGGKKPRRRAAHPKNAKRVPGGIMPSE